MINHIKTEKEIHTDQFDVFVPASFYSLAQEMVQIAKRQLATIYDCFGINHFRKIQVNLFDDKEQFRKYIMKIRGDDGSSLPEWAGGTYDLGNVNMYLLPDTITNPELYQNQKYTIAHEMSHIIYWELFLGDHFDNRVIWLDEGIAQILSGQREDVELGKFFKDYILTIPKLPSLNELTWDNFITNDYNGYDLSYFAARYLMETMSKEELRHVMKSRTLSLAIGEDVLAKAISYYKNIF